MKVNQSTLKRLAGAVWVLAGVMLASRGIGMLRSVSETGALTLTVAVLLALAVFLDHHDLHAFV